MRSYTQEELDKLIKCRKIITKPPKEKMRLEKGSYRNDMELFSEDKQFRFTSFMRRNEDYPENFSIGLDYHPKEERASICLIRCNGPHGDFNSAESNNPHFQSHVHKAKAENIEAGLRPEKHAEIIDAYASYEEALQYFLKYVNAINTSQYPELLQLKMDLQNKGS